MWRFDLELDDSIYNVTVRSITWRLEYGLTIQLQPPLDTIPIVDNKMTTSFRDDTQSWRYDDNLLRRRYSELTIQWRPYLVTIPGVDNTITDFP